MLSLKTDMKMSREACWPFRKLNLLRHPWHVLHVQLLASSASWAAVPRPSALISSSA